MALERFCLQYIHLHKNLFKHRWVVGWFRFSSCDTTFGCFRKWIFQEEKPPEMMPSWQPPLGIPALWTSWQYLAGWWFGTFFIFPYIGNNHPNWLIFFRGVQTTNQLATQPNSPSKRASCPRPELVNNHEHHTTCFGRIILGKYDILHFYFLSWMYPVANWHHLHNPCFFVWKRFDFRGGFSWIWIFFVTCL